MVSGGLLEGEESRRVTGALVLKVEVEKFATVIPGRGVVCVFVRGRERV